MGCCFTSWFSKKQTALAIFTTEAEYVSAEKAFQQALWMKQTLVDYNIKLDDIPILCDNKGAIDLSKNPVSSEDNIADILTKPLKRELFNLLRLGAATAAITATIIITSSSSPSPCHPRHHHHHDATTPLIIATTAAPQQVRLAVVTANGMFVYVV
ncbi:hypothetical protein Tco_1265768 [Tanacetum coccineum]